MECWVDDEDQLDLFDDYLKSKEEALRLLAEEREQALRDEVEDKMALYYGEYLDGDV